MSAALSCNHRTDGLATDWNSSNRWPDPRAAGPMIWITCPRKWARFITTTRSGTDQLFDWAVRGMPGGAVVWNDILWVVAPDPGCE